MITSNTTILMFYIFGKYNNNINTKYFNVNYEFTVYVVMIISIFAA